MDKERRPTAHVPPRPLPPTHRPDAQLSTVWQNTNRAKEVVAGRPPAGRPIAGRRPRPPAGARSQHPHI
eukprot:scaffold11107_cov115-Isochrysis_galbana.AAC.4